MIYWIGFRGERCAKPNEIGDEETLTAANRLVGGEGGSGTADPCHE